MKKYLLLLFVLASLVSFSQQADKYILLKPDRVFDGEQMQTGWVVLVKNNKIEQAGAMQFKLPAGTKVIELKGMTLLPGLIEGHSHLFLQPYNERSWDDQVLKLPPVIRRWMAQENARENINGRLYNCT